MTGFRDGSLPATVMNRIAKGFSDDETARDCGVARGTEVRGTSMGISHRISRRDVLGAGAATRRRWRFRCRRSRKPRPASS